MLLLYLMVTQKIWNIIISRCNEYKNYWDISHSIKSLTAGMFHIYTTSSFWLATFQVPNSHVWLEATVLKSRDPWVYSQLLPTTLFLHTALSPRCLSFIDLQILNTRWRLRGLTILNFAKCISMLRQSCYSNKQPQISVACDHHCICHATYPVWISCHSTPCPLHPETRQMERSSLVEEGREIMEEHTLSLKNSGRKWYTWPMKQVAWLSWMCWGPEWEGICSSPLWRGNKHSE